MKSRALELGPATTIRRSRAVLRAESDGFVFFSTISISESSSGSITLTSSHDSQPQGIIAKLLSIPMGLLFKGVAKKALLQDLNDIKSAVERE
jgi:hypothetical protein